MSTATDCTLELFQKAMPRIGVLVFPLCAFGLLTSPSMAEEVKFFEEPVAEKKVTELPSGQLYWRLENFPTLAQAQGAVGPTWLAAEVARRGQCLRFRLCVSSSAAGSLGAPSVVISQK
jgi:hypothetical protein